MPDSATPDDDVLVAGLLRGSETALGLLYDRHGPAVYQVALRRLRDPGAAEEVVQETFLQLWDRAEQFDPARGSLGSWLTVIARSRAIDRHRATARRLAAQPFSAVVGELPDPAATIDWLLETATPIGLGAADGSPELQVLTAEARDTIALAVAELADDERTAILLAYRDGLSQAEIADRLGWPLGTVKTRSRRALRHLRERLEVAGADGAGEAATTTRPMNRIRMAS